MKVIKTVFLALCLAAFIPTAQAQKFGVKAGVNYANVSGDADTDAMTGFHLGVFKEVTLVPELFFLQPEVQYSMQGSKNKDNDQDETIGYINVPVVAKVYILKLISLEAGPQVGFKINDNLEGEAGDNINTVDMGIAAGAGLNFPLGLSINLRYIQGFTDIVDDVDSKHQVLQLGAAFKF